MKITNEMIEKASEAYARKRHPARWDGAPWGLAGQENHRRAIKAAIEAAFKEVEKKSK